MASYDKCVKFESRDGAPGVRSRPDGDDWVGRGFQPRRLGAGGESGDGEKWSPEIKVKGGNSAFYSIGVGKGE